MMKRGSQSSKDKGETHTVHRDLPQARAVPTAGRRFPTPTLAGESTMPRPTQVERQTHCQG